MQTRFTYLLKYFVAISDVFLVNVVFYCYTMFAGETFHPDMENSQRYYLLLVNFIWLVSAVSFGLYGGTSLDKLEQFYRKTLSSGITHFILFSSTLFFIGNHGLFLGMLQFFYPALALGLILSRFAGTWLQTVFVRHFATRRSVAIIGNNPGGKKLASYFNDHRHSYLFRGFLSESHSMFINERGELTPEGAGELQKAIDNHIDEVYVSVKPEYMAAAAPLVAEAERQCIRVKLVPDLSADAEVPYDVSYIGGMPVLSMLHQPAYEIENRFKKRAFDMMVSLLVLVLILSWLYPLLALLIKLESRGPVLFRQQRSGRDNKPFWCYKFRSMRMNSDSDVKQATREDPRITRLGRFMRKTSIDELPQFLNVLQGYMSVVGPRPHMIKHTEQYRDIIEKYMIRQFLKPGITGWAQVNGYRGETKDPGLMERRVAHDIWYMENWSAMLDVRIVFMTVINMIAGEENAG